MRNILCLALLPMLVAGCSHEPQISESEVLQIKLKNERQYVVGHFRDPNVKDTVFVELVDAKTLKYAPAKLDSDWDRNLELLVKRDTRLQLVSHDQTVLISDYEQVVSTSLLENLGDLDGDKLDEIGLVWYAEDYSSLNMYYIYQYVNGKLMETSNFKINDNMLEDKKPFVKKWNSDTILCREYDVEGIAPEYVKKKL